MGDQLFLNIEQIIPMKDAEDFMISIADKALDEVEGVIWRMNRTTYHFDPATTRIQCGC